MKRTLVVLLFFVAARSLAQALPTKCLTTNVQLNATTRARQLVACDASFTDNVLWHLDRADSVSGELDGVFHRGLTGRGAVIYVADTGVLQAHSEFQRTTGPSVIHGIHNPEIGFPFGGCADPALAPTCNVIITHGTSVASVANGRLLGIAPDAKVVAVVAGDPSWEWIVSMNKIIKHAFEPTTPPFRTAIINYSAYVNVREEHRAAFDERIRTMVAGVDANGNPDPNGKRFFFVIAGGNAATPMGNGQSTPTQCGTSGEVIHRPAILGTQIDGLVSVGAITSANHLWDYTCKGAGLELAAPGANMFLASNQGNDLYRLDPEVGNSGSSYAAPFVSGIAALHLELDPTLTPAQLEARLKASASRADGLTVPVVPPVPFAKRRSVR
jgi:subtilisin family serine protease